MTKAVFITNVPAPYRVAMLNRARILLQTEGIELKVVFSALGYRRRHYWADSIAAATFSYRILNESSIQLGSDKLMTLGWTMPRVLKEERPSLVVVAGFSFPSILASRYAMRQGIPFLVYSGETKYRAKILRLKFLRNRVRRYMLSKCAGCISYGTEATSYLEGNGVQRAKIFTAINSIDTGSFRCQVFEYRNRNPSVECDRPKMLYVGNLFREKGLEYVLHALAVLARTGGPQPFFEIVGGGPDQTRLEALARELALQKVLFAGPKQTAEVIPYYATCDFFVFPSFYDIFGLVLVEAAAAGLPIIASRFAGGAADVVEDGKNGYIVDPRNVEVLAARIAELTESKEKRDAMGRYSLKIVEDRVNLDRSAQGFADAVIQTLNR